MSTDPPDVLVAHASRRGATAGIATTIGGKLRARGLRVDVSPAAEVDDLGRYRSGAPITFGGFLDPTTARGPLARRTGSGALAGDVRDPDRIRRRAAGIATDLTAPDTAAAADRPAARR